MRGGRVIDTSGALVSQGGGEYAIGVFDQVADVLIRDGNIVQIQKEIIPPETAEIIDATGKVVCPGFVDLHVHFREPGEEYKEDISTGTKAAAAGGFTTVCCMPNTKPVNDCRSVTDLITRKAHEVGIARVLPIGAISKGLKGNSLSEMGEMQEAGIVAVSDDGQPIMNAGLMRRALEYAKTFDLPVVQHAEDLDLAEGGHMNEGVVSTRIGVQGQPSQAESIMVARDLELVQLTGARYHVAHISAKRSVEMVRAAKAKGLPVSCEVTPHHFSLTDEACASYNTSTKCMPPLRTEEDIGAIISGLQDGTIDCIATDHAPHSDVEKDHTFGCASPGMIGLETALSLTLDLVNQGHISLSKAIHLLSAGPAKTFGLDKRGIGSLKLGTSADLTIFDPTRNWTITGADSHSRSKNSPFEGREVPGVVLLTVYGGNVVYNPERLFQNE